jgi:NhaA family Na+:H+ antiporter
MVRPVQRVLSHEAAGGLVMLAAAIVAIAWANSPWSQTYVDLWATPLRIELGAVLHLDHLTLQAWVNDALMSLFFLLVGVEIKREFVHGDLQDVRAVALPVAAAIGGMALPALLYAAMNAGGPGADGWGIPMATDIAFAVGVVSLLGSRVPAGAKVFLLTLAVADDIGAIVVIAVFYTGDLSLGWLALALLGVLAIARLGRSDVQALGPYLVIGTFVWLALLESGVHATLVGVALGLLTPAWPHRSPRRYPAEARRMVDAIERSYYDRVLSHEEFEDNEHLIAEVQRLSTQSTSPLSRLERALSPWVAFVIVPLFALANAGVRLSSDALSGLVDDPVSAGVAVGLVGGKTVGVLLASALAVRLGLGRLPDRTTWVHVLGLAMVAGVGVTVSLCVTTISFTDPALTDSAKIGILAGSLVAGVAGYSFLRWVPRSSISDPPVTPTAMSAPERGPDEGEPSSQAPSLTG